MVIEDDRDDQELLEETFSSLSYPNQVIFFRNGDEALTYLKKANTPPVLIISDVNMPKVDGFEVKKEINGSRQLQNLHIPFVFFTTSARREAVVSAFALSDQGFFSKPYNMEDLRKTIKTIVDYWLRCHTPGVY